MAIAHDYMSATLTGAPIKVPASISMKQAMTLALAANAPWFEYTTRGRTFAFSIIEDLGVDGLFVFSVESDLDRLAGVPLSKRPVVYLDGEPTDPGFTSNVVAGEDDRVVDVARNAREMWMERHV